MEFPFVIFADFESRQEPISSVQPDPKESFTEKIQKHIPCSFAFHMVSPFTEKQPVLFRAKSDEEDVGAIFVRKLTKFIREIQEEFKIPKAMIFGEEEKKKFESAKTCWICEWPFENSKEKKVGDHCHFTGKYRGAAHNSCNLQFRKPKFTPVSFHNLTGYDSHLFVKSLGLIPGDLKCLPNNEEKFIFFSKKILLGVRDDGKKIWHEIRFLDSARFMASPLDCLVKNLTADDFIETKKAFGEKVYLMKRKGVFPYEWLDSVEKFKFQFLPQKAEFFSTLNDEGISDDDNQFAQKIWNEFQMKNMGNFHDTYLLADVVLLADVFQEFRKVCRKHYELDPAWIYTSPSLAWDAALKESRVELELLTDPEKLLFFLKEEFAVVFPQFFIVMPEQTTSSWKVILTLKNHQNFLLSLMQTDFMLGP